MTMLCAQGCAVNCNNWINKKVLRRLPYAQHRGCLLGNANRLFLSCRVFFGELGSQSFPHSL